MFRLPRDRALINRMGFNNDGRPRRRRGSRRASPPARRAVVGVNIGKTKRGAEADAIADYARSARALAPFADYLVVNVSSPNTPGLRDLQAVDQLRPLLAAVRAALDAAVPGRRVPLLVKIAPDLADADIDAIADLALELGLDGIIATNTTISGPGWPARRPRSQRPAPGGLSGAPLRARSLAGAAPAARAGRRPAGAHRGRRHRDRRRRLGADPRRRDAGPGLHRLRLRRPAVAAPDARRAGPADPGSGVYRPQLRGSPRGGSSRRRVAASASSSAAMPYGKAWNRPP